MKTINNKKYAQDAIEFWEGVLTRINQNKTLVPDMIAFKKNVENGISAWKTYLLCLNCQKGSNFQFSDPEKDRRITDCRV